MSYEILSKIESPADLKALSKEELDLLCAEIREKLIDVISVNGGHLSSNLYPVSQFLVSGGQRIGVSASTSVLPMNTQD